MKQATLNKAFTVVGKGLHTGVMIHATLKPAEVNTGIRFCRVDLPDRPCYSASVQYVSQTSRGTVLENGTWRVSTVEHMMAALYAMGVTNCLIDVDAPEVPILDGSAHPYIKQIKAVGIVEQDAERNEWVVAEPIHFDNGKGCKMTISPCDHYEVEVTVDYHSPVLGQQTAELHNLADFDTEIAPARTFCFLREIKPLINLGLIKGGDMQNALVIYDKRLWQWQMDRLARKLGQPSIDASQLGYLSPLKYNNEPARHKLLDLVGDMALLGVYIRGKISAECPGHGFNTSCGKQIYKSNNLQINI